MNTTLVPIARPSPAVLPVSISRPLAVGVGCISLELASGTPIFVEIGVGCLVDSTIFGGEGALARVVVEGTLPRAVTVRAGDAL